MTYTITVTNNAEKPFESPKITDTLEPSLITLVENSVKEGETTAYHKVLTKTNG